MTEYRQNHVSRVVWPWLAVTDRPAAPTGMSARKKVLITTPIAYAIAGLIYVLTHHVVGPIAVVVIATAIAFCGFFIPPAYAAIERFFFAFGALVAAALTWILLVPVFYLVFLPARIILTLKKSDPMKRACPSDEATYWTTRPPIERKNYYRSQH